MIYDIFRKMAANGLRHESDENFSDDDGSVPLTQEIYGGRWVKKLDLNEKLNVDIFVIQFVALFKFSASFLHNMHKFMY